MHYEIVNLGNHGRALQCDAPQELRARSAVRDPFGYDSVSFFIMYDNSAEIDVLRGKQAQGIQLKMVA